MKQGIILFSENLFFLQNLAFKTSMKENNPNLFPSAFPLC